MKYEPIKKHYKHPIYMLYGKFGPHKGKIMCKLCNEFVKWANEKEIKEMNK